LGEILPKMSSFLRILSGLKNIKSGTGGSLSAAIEDSVVQSQARLFGSQSQASIDVPTKPKRPLTPYFRFLGQVRDQVRKENPTIKHTELIKLVAQRWQELDDPNKERYITAYKNELQTYGSIIAGYNASLTDEQRGSIQQLKEEKQVKKERREKRLRLKELGRPKRPPSAFLQFLQTNIPEGMSSNEYLERAKTLGAKWKTMSDTEKAVYSEKYQKDLEQYQKVLLKWEEKMIKMGNEDLVRHRPPQKAAGAKSK